jgi:Transcriptional repressor TCF25
MGDQSQADDLLDRCLYAFEMAWHHSFSIASANCMLDPEHSENKGFLEALFRQLQVPTRCCLIPAALAVVALTVSAIAVHANCPSWHGV